MEKAKTRLLGRVSSGFGKTLAYLVMGLFTAMALYPVLWLVLNSFKSSTEYQMNMLGFPKDWIMSNYPDAWQLGNFGTLIVNSVIYTVVSTLGILFFSLLAGFAFSKIKKRVTAPIYRSFVIGILLSLTSIMVPIFIEISQMDKLVGAVLSLTGLIKAESFHFFYNTRIGVILIYIGSGLPLSVFLCTEYMKSIPDAVVEAARIDGAAMFTIFRKIILPMSLPILTTVAIISVPSIWNEFALINIVVADPGLKSLPLGILMFNGTLSVDYGKIFAALVIGMAPMLIFYVAFRKHITRGVAGGAVKG